MKKTTLHIIILLLVAAILIIVIGMRIGAMAASEVEHTLSVTTAAKAIDPLEATPQPTVDPLDTDDPKPTPMPTEEPDDETMATALEVVDEPVMTPVEDQPIVGQPEQGRYGSLLLCADEIETIARLVMLESGGESFAGQQAVAEVILNRVLSPAFPNNVYDVVYQGDPTQFTPASQIPYTTATQTQYDAVAAALYGPNILPQSVLYFACSMNGRTQAWGWIGGHVFCY